MHNPTQKCRPAKGISKRVNMQIIQDRPIIWGVDSDNNLSRYAPISNTFPVDLFNRTSLQSVDPARDRT
jgi:hypothetical protein